MKKRKGFTLIHLLIFLTIFAVVGAYNFSIYPTNIENNVTNDELIQRLHFLDARIMQYRASHAEYPSSLEDLTKINLLSSNFDIKKYNYNKNDNSYSLSIKIDNQEYISPCSNQ